MYRGYKMVVNHFLTVKENLKKHVYGRAVCYVYNFIFDRYIIATNKTIFGFQLGSTYPVLEAKKVGNVAIISISTSTVVVYISGR